MKEITAMAGGLTVGLDLGDRYTHFCTLDAQGRTVQEGRFATSAGEVSDRFEGRPAMRIALEVGSHAIWVSRLLRSWGHEVIVANARKLRLIYQNESKSDAVDAQYLARLARMDPQLLSPLPERSTQTQTDLTVVRARQACVRARTAMVHFVRGRLKSEGVTMRRCGVEVFPQKTLPQIPTHLRVALEPMLEAMGSLNKQILSYDRAMLQIAKDRYPQVALLRQVHGVGPITALSFVLLIEDPRRFATSRQVGSYFGLRPGQKDSGQSQPQCGITKAGNSSMRALLVQCAHYILGRGRDSDLKRWGQARIERGGKAAKKRVIVAMARKLAVLLHRLWVSGEVYEPLREGAKKQPTAVSA